LLFVVFAACTPVVFAQGGTLPRISSVATSPSVAEGQTVSFAVTVTGTAPFTYQWKKGGADLAGATSATLTLGAVRLADAGSFTVVAANSSGIATGGPYVLTVTADAAPVVEAISFPAGVVLGDSFSLPLLVKGTAPFTYQWRKDGVPIAGETKETFSRTSAAVADVGTYSVTVTNPWGSVTSPSGYISISFPLRPIIYESPKAQTATIGDTVSLSVLAVGSGARPSDGESAGDLTYQWRRNGTAIADAITRNYRFTVNAASGARDAYTVLVTNPQGAVLSEPAVVTVPGPVVPVVVGDPASQVLRQGEEILLTVDATGTIAPTYQWRKDGVVIPGAVASTYSKPNANTTDAGTYTVVVRTGAGADTSAPARVTVLPALVPVITTHPASSSLPPSNFVPYLSVNVRSSLGVTYQWRKDGVPIIGANNSRTFSLASPQPASPGAYTVVVTNAIGSVTSHPGVVTVDATPLITYSSGGEVVSIGDYLRLDLLLNVETATIQWRKDGVVIPAATASSWVVPSVSANSAGAYLATVTAAGSPTVTSRPIPVEILDLGVAPRILRHPGSQTRAPGTRANFVVSAEGERPFTYQWSKDGVAMLGATAVALAIISPVAASAGSYAVIVTNRHGSAQSDRVALSILSAPAPALPIINMQPALLVLFRNTAGDSLSVGLESTVGVTYQWRKDGAVIPNATSFTYRLSPDPATAGRYDVTIANAAGSISSNEVSVAVVDFPAAPMFTSQPSSQSVLLGTIVTFAATATGSSLVRYQWRKDGVDLPGATAAALVLPYAPATAAGTYTVLATTMEGVASSSAALLTITSPPAGLPRITAQPVGATVIPTGSVTLTAGVAANPAATYQWFRNGQSLAGETALTLALTNVTSAATYTVVATNSYGSTPSAPVSVRLGASLDFGPSTPSQTVAAGSPATLTVAVQSPSPLIYQWRKNDVDVPGATGVTLLFAATKPADAGAYTLVATHSEGSLVSAPIVLGVSVSPFAGVYFGTLASGEPFALSVGPDAVGALIGFRAGANQAVIARGFIVQSDGTFTATGETTTRQLASLYTGTVTGVVGAGTVTGNLVAGDIAFFGTQKMATGGSGSIAGYYQGVTIAAALGEMHVIVAADGTLQLVALDTTGARAASGQVTATGAFSVGQPLFTYSGNLGVNGAALTGTFQPTGGTAVSLAAPGALDGIERLANVSTRALAGSGARTLIAGFAINGTTPKDVLVRASGPALTLFGVPGILPNPRLRIFKDATALFENDDWSIGGSVPQISAAAARVGAFPLGIGSLDATLLVRLDPGSYTAQVSNAAVAAGVALVEVYDASFGSIGAQKLINVSTRADVGTGGDILIVGVVVAGTAPKKLLIRGIGPALAAFDVSGALAAPRLQLYRGSQLLRENTSWSAGTDAALIAAAALRVGAFALPDGSKDCALLLYLAPGSYTAQISGVANTTGVALVEVYEVP
jgi:hypothetical protein